MATILKKILLETGVSQNALSQLARVPASNLSLIVNNKLKPGPAWRARISDALGIPEEIIFSDESEVK